MEAAARADAVDRGDHRLPHLVVPRGEVEVELLDRLAVALHALAVGRDLVHVDAGLERAALAGVHDHAHLGIGVERAPRELELVAHVRAHRVELVGPVVDQPADRAPPLQLQRVQLRIRHGVLSSCVPQRALRRGQLVRRAAARSARPAPARPRAAARAGRPPRSRCRARSARRAGMRSCRPGERHAQHRLHRRLLRQRDRLVHARLPDRHVRIEERRASAAAITTSASATKCSPPPAHTPLTAAITGFVTSLCHAVKRSSNRFVRRLCSRSASRSRLICATSTPVWNASPAPVLTITRTSGSASSSLPRVLELVHHARVHRVAGRRAG